MNKIIVSIVFAIILVFGINKIAEVAKDFGLGQKYQINLANQKTGIIPSKNWKKNKLSRKIYA